MAHATAAKRMETKQERPRIKAYHSLDYVAQRLGVTVDEARNLVITGPLDGWDDGRQILVHEADLAAFEDWCAWPS